jgi:hypothetical protein
MIGTVDLRVVPACVESCLAPQSASARTDSARTGTTRSSDARARADAPGVIMLALDGLALHVAAETLAHAELTAMRSTFPSTSATAWLTSVTGLDASEHGAVGAVLRVPGTDRLVNAVTGTVYGTSQDPDSSAERNAEPFVLESPTIFDRARTLGVEPLALGPELAALRGQWIRALLHGVTLRAADNEPPARNVSGIVERSAREIDQAIARPRTGPLLLWAHVNLDEHIHRHGYDAPLQAAVRFLDEAACRWAERGWTVLAYADHGQVPVRLDEQLADRWAALDHPRHCRAPSGGAGRVRWLHPRAGHEERLADELRAALGEHAFVFTPGELDDRGLMKVTPVVRARIGEIVAVGVSPRFPVPDPSVAYEHGSITEDEMSVPFAAWGAPEFECASFSGSTSTANVFASTIRPAGLPA